MASPPTASITSTTWYNRTYQILSGYQASVVLRVWWVQSLQGIYSVVQLALIHHHGLVVGILFDLIDQVLLAEMAAFPDIAFTSESQLLGNL